MLRGMRPLLLSVVVSCSLLAASASLARKVGVLPLSAGAGVDGKTAAALTEALAGELARVPGTDVITQAQMRALLDLEAQRRLVGCDDDSCMAQIGAALGVDELIGGSVSLVGSSWLVGVRKVEVKTAGSRLADRRFKGGSLDDVLDALPGLVAEVSQAAPSAAPVPTGALAIAPSGPAPAGGSDKDAGVAPAVRKRMIAVADGKGLVIAYDPKSEDSFAPFYAGRDGALFAQRISGGGREGDKSFDIVFWEPRVAERWRAAFGKKDGKHWLQCGDQKIELSPRALPSSARLLQVRWQRRLAQLARTEDGVYFVVDVAREPEGSRDFRLHVGRPGAFSYLRVDEAMLERDESVFTTAQGRLNVGHGASWTPKGGAPVPLKALPVEDHAAEVYGAWRVYGEPLGTACDGLW
ncbi:MAG: hypothetical protein A2138_02755 [Deltaproteobacteria bacterium RBG_16_71_12]|nr:MAG: hypothetical protein A2138_02755 [Deltaproteobacteria bacterium RBG_16_71_12]